MHLINKLIPTLNLPYVKPISKCKVFKDNKSTIAIAKVPSMLLYTKHIGLKYHYFKQFVLNGSININYVSTEK